MSNRFNEDKRSIIIKTCELYPDVFKKSLKKFLGLPQNTTVVKYLNSDISDEKLKEIIIKIEDFEYNINYLYNFLFLVKNLEEIEDLIKNNYLENYINQKETDYLSNKIELPSLKNDNDNVILKFSKIIKSEKGEIKLPCILFLNFKNKYIHLKIRRVPNNFNLNNREIYLNIISEIKKWFLDKFNVDLRSKDIFFNAVDIFKNSFYGEEGLEAINPIAFNCNDKQNGTIRIRTNQKNIMPILSELKRMATTFKEDEDRKKLEEYLKSLIEEVDYYKVKLGYKIEEKEINIEFTRRYENTDDTLIYFDYNSLSNEEKKNVIEFFIKHRKNS